MIYYDLIKLSETLFDDIKIDTRSDFLNFLSRIEYESYKKKQDKEGYIQKIVFDLDKNKEVHIENEIVTEDLLKKYIITILVNNHEGSKLASGNTLKIKDNIVIKKNKREEENIIINLYKICCSQYEKRQIKEEEYNLMCEFYNYFNKNRDFVIKTIEKVDEEKFNYIVLGFKKNNIEYLISQMDFYMNNKYNAFFEVEDKRSDICYLCHTKQEISYEYLTKLKELKYFTSTNEYYASDLKKSNYLNRFAICENCYKRLLVLDKYFNEYKSSIGLNVVFYPKIIGKIEKQEKKIIEKIFKNTKDVLFDAGSKKRSLRNIEKLDIKDGNYLLNFLLVEESQASRKIVDNIRDIRPSRYLAVQELISDYFSSYEEFKKVYDNNIKSNFNLFILKIKIQKNFEGKTASKIAAKYYFKLLDSILSGSKKIDMRIIYNMLATSIVKDNAKEKKHSTWYFDIFLLMYFIKFFRTKLIDIDNLKRSGNVKIYNELKNSDNERVKFICDYAERMDFKTDDELICLMAGFLAGNVGAAQLAKKNSAFYYSIGNVIQKRDLLNIITKAITKGNVILEGFESTNAEILKIMPLANEINLDSSLITLFFFAGIGLYKTFSQNKKEDKE